MSKDAADRTCPCGSAVPHGRQGRWCSSWCRARDEQGLPAQPPPGVAPSLSAPTVPAPRLVPSRPSLVDRVRERLEVGGLDETWQAEQAVDLAERIVDGTAKGSALAALHRELRAVMSELLQGRDEPGSAVAGYRDELAARRARRGGA